MFGPCIRSYNHHLRKVICMEWTHLSEKYFDTLLTACVSDAESHIFHVTFVVLGKRIKIGDPGFLLKHDLVIISHKQKGLRDVVPLVLWKAHHNYCLKHLA